VTTAADILTRAARALGYLGFTEVLSAADSGAALDTFNAMLDSWSGGEFLTSYVTQEQSFPLVIGQQTYTIGTSGSPDINTTRPSAIFTARVRDSNNLDYRMEVIPQEQWDDIGNKLITSQIPTTLFYYRTYPNAVINIFPIPLLAYTVYFTSSLDQVTFATLTQTLSMPPGYERAYVFNLAVELMGAGWPCLLNEKQLAALINNATDSKANVKRTNMDEILASYDDAIVSQSYATYNVYSDGNPRN
jgi:hypothetical protein